MLYSRRRILQGGAIAIVPVASLDHVIPDALTPEMFGAKGDGTTNDTDAFARLSDAVNARNGARIVFRPATYVVGSQKLSREDWAYEPASLLHIRGCTRPVEICGNGGRLLAAPGLKFGAFDRDRGIATRNVMPNFKRDERATPYSYMILIEDCAATVTILDLELDGNVQNMKIGGQYGDVGWQIPATGIFLRNNRGDEFIRNVYSHHHAQDGLMLDGDDDQALALTVTREITRYRGEYNGRQGCSIVGGRGYVFSDCGFNHTGKAGLASGPGAGVDIEAEGKKTNRSLKFVRCEFADNYGCGMIAASGSSDGATFIDCRFVGTTAWSAWPAKPNIRFERCIFAGAVVGTYQSDDATKATRFDDCVFSDDLPNAPMGATYLGGKTTCPIVDTAGGKNVRFNRCRFRLVGRGTLPWSTGAIYSDCRMTQRAGAKSYPRGSYLGHNFIVGPADLSGSMVSGTLLLNGKRIAGRNIGIADAR